MSIQRVPFSDAFTSTERIQKNVAEQKIALENDTLRCHI